MVPSFKLRTASILPFVVVFLVCALTDTPRVLAQRLPGREPENKPAPSRRQVHPKHPTAPAASTNPAAVESGNFLDLAERFRKQNKWKAAEAAYKEAVKAWPANVDARLALGFLYLDRNRIDEAQQTYTELRSLNASYAANLLAEINRHKAALAH